MAITILDYSKLNTNPNAKVIISLPGNIMVSGFVTSTLGIGAGNEFGTPLLNAAQQQLTQTIQSTQAAAAGWADKLGFKGLDKPISLNTVQQSVKLWTNSSLPIFNVNLKFIAVNEGDDVRLGVSRLLSAVLPTFENYTSLASSINPPLGYLPITKTLTASGTFVVTIGNWFRAKDQVMTNVTFDFSKEVISSGAPLYAEGSISFTPFRVISARDMAQYLMQSS